MGQFIKSIKKNFNQKQIAKTKRNIRKLKLGQTSNLLQLDERLQNFTLFISLKLFRYYNKVVQQTNNKKKAMVKQLIAVATLLLIHDASQII